MTTDRAPTLEEVKAELARMEEWAKGQFLVLPESPEGQYLDGLRRAKKRMEAEKMADQSEAERLEGISTFINNAISWAQLGPSDAMAAIYEMEWLLAIAELVAAKDARIAELETELARERGPSPEYKSPPRTPVAEYRRCQEPE